MKKGIYFLLLLTTIGMGAYTLFFASTSNQAKIQAETKTATMTPVATTTQQEENAKKSKTFTTKTGNTITVKETNPAGESLSTLEISITGFASSSPIILEKNKLTDAFLVDINNDGYDELVIVTTAAGSGSYGDISVLTTKNKFELVTIPQIKEEDTKKGGLFEGYQGHDSFIANNNKLIREFPIYLTTDTNDNPTGGKRTLVYTLTEKNSIFSMTIQKEKLSATTTISTTNQQATTTKK